MIVSSNNDWERRDKAGLVSVGSYSLFVSTGGPPRKPKAPVVIFITGGGAPTEIYLHLHRAVSKFARNYFPDRAGYGRSERHKKDSTEHDDDDDDDDDDGHVTAEDSAAELRRLMLAIGVQPPYVLVAHSFGGIVARTYYGLYPDDVAGMALLDTNTDLLQQCLSPIPPKSFANVTAGVYLEELTHLREASGMTDAEWEAAQASVERTKPGSADEATHRSGRELARRMQIDCRAMGDKPLVVMRADMAGDFRLMFEEGVRRGGGTKEDRRLAAWWVESMELFYPQVTRVQLELSSNAEYVVFDDVGHDFPIRSPERTARVIHRLLPLVQQRL